MKVQNRCPSGKEKRETPLRISLSAMALRRSRYGLNPGEKRIIYFNICQKLQNSAFRTETCTESPGRRDSCAMISFNAMPIELPRQCA